MFLGDVKEKKIANLLGSSGKKAVALSLLGAQVTVVDITEENQRYALECARAAGVSLDYIVSYDILKLEGKLVLHEFYPIIKKCAPKQDGDRWVLEGDYFSEEIIEKPAPRALSAFSQEEVDSFPPGRYRYWQMGEIVSAFCNQNLIIETLVENPHGNLSRLPETFTLVARK